MKCKQINNVNKCNRVTRIFTCTTYNILNRIDNGNTCNEVDYIKAVDIYNLVNEYNNIMHIVHVCQ